MVIRCHLQNVLLSKNNTIRDSLYEKLIILILFKSGFLQIIILFDSWQLAKFFFRKETGCVVSGNDYEHSIKAS